MDTNHCTTNLPFSSNYNGSTPSPYCPSLPDKLAFMRKKTSDKAIMSLTNYPVIQQQKSPHKSMTLQQKKLLNQNPKLPTKSYQNNLFIFHKNVVNATILP
jgi:hypothetical protein